MALIFTSKSGARLVFAPFYPTHTLTLGAFYQLYFSHIYYAVIYQAHPRPSLYNSFYTVHNDCGYKRPGRGEQAPSFAWFVFSWAVGRHMVMIAAMSLRLLGTSWGTYTFVCPSPFALSKILTFTLVQASAAFPENTLASFEAAIRDGSEGIESGISLFFRFPPPPLCILPISRIVTRSDALLSGHRFTRGASKSRAYLLLHSPCDLRYHIPDSEGLPGYNERD